METENTYVYFALTGADFDLQNVTQRIGVHPTQKWNKGDKGIYKKALEYSCWKLATNKEEKCILIGSLVDEVINKLFDKIEIINELKNQYNLDSVLEIVMYINTNEEQVIPALSYSLKSIEFLHRTQTITDVDIYRFNSIPIETHYNGLKHEVWQESNGLTTLCLADKSGDGCRKLLELGSEIIHEFYASSHFEAMTIYYKFMEWGIYTTEFEIDKEPYDNKIRL